MMRRENRATPVRAPGDGDRPLACLEASLMSLPNDTIPPIWTEYAVPLHPDFAWTPIDRTAPIAYVGLGQTVFADRGEWPRWQVHRCPYCGGRHDHSAGSPGDDPRRFLGGRIAHCFPDSGSGEYRLVESCWSAQQVPAVRVGLSAELRAMIWAKSGGRCWYCGVQTNPFRDFACDHVHPVIDGGTNDPANLVPCCRRCNGQKHAMSLEVYRSRTGGGLFWFEIVKAFPEETTT